MTRMTNARNTLMTMTRMTSARKKMPAATTTRAQTVMCRCPGVLVVLRSAKQSSVVSKKPVAHPIAAPQATNVHRTRDVLPHLVKTISVARKNQKRSTMMTTTRMISARSTTMTTTKMTSARNTTMMTTKMTSARSTTMMT